MTKKDFIEHSIIHMAGHMLSALDKDGNHLFTPEDVFEAAKYFADKISEDLDPIHITGLDFINDINREDRHRNGVKVNERRIRLVLDIYRKWMNIDADINKHLSCRTLTDDELALREKARMKIYKATDLFYQLSGNQL